MPFSASADEMLDAAKSEMETALGAVPPFIALLPGGAQARRLGLHEGELGQSRG